MGAHALKQIEVTKTTRYLAHGSPRLTGHEIKRRCLLLLFAIDVKRHGMQTKATKASLAAVRLSKVRGEKLRAKKIKQGILINSTVFQFEDHTNADCPQVDRTLRALSIAL